MSRGKENKNGNVWYWVLCNKRRIYFVWHRLFADEQQMKGVNMAEEVNTIPEEEMDQAEDIQEVVKEVINREYLTSLHAKGVPIETALKQISEEKIPWWKFWQKAKLKSETKNELRKEIQGVIMTLHNTPANTPAYDSLTGYLKILVDSLASLETTDGSNWKTVLQWVGGMAAPVIGAVAWAAINQKFGEYPGNGEAKKSLFGGKKWF